LPDALALICYDGSDDARNAIHRAGAVLGPRPAVVFTAWETASLALSLGSATAAPIPDVDAITGPLSDRAQAIAEEGVALARRESFTARPLVVQAAGPIWDEAIRAAEAVGAEVIVVGSRGHGSIHSLLLGSTSNGIVHHATCPTLVIRRTDA
jgi:nucleotide-binding universal stress UspA family protein